MASKFHNKIKDAVIERQVEDIYNEGINMYFPVDGGIEYPFNCDGFVCTKTERGNLLRLIIEYKFNEMMTNKVARAKVLVQVVFYMKRFEQAGLILPNVCMVGDKDECFVMHTNTLLKYLDEDVDWGICPSDAAKKCPDLVLKISQDEEINPFIFNVDENFSFKDVSDKINELADNIKRYVRVTEHNLAKIFDYFCKNVLKGRAKMSGHDQVEVFMGVIGNHTDYYQHPMKKNILVCKGREVTIDGDAFKSFFGYFDRNYTPQEKMRLDGIADRLIEDTDRRRRGDFWTPTVWVDYAHDMISKQLGEDWKEKYVVWDNCCYDEDTEFLTPNGWKYMKDYAEGDLVMQYNMDGSGSFVKPLRYLNHPYKGEWINFKSSQVDIKTTSEHDYVVKNDKGGEWYKKNVLEIYNKAQEIKNLHLVIPVSFDYHGDVHVDENILRLAIAINADGCYVPYTTLNNNKGRTPRNTRFTENDTSDRDCYTISVKKERKKERIRFLLKNANIEYKEQTTREYSVFTFHFPFNPKHFPTEWYHLDKESKMVFIDEVFYWDGSLCVENFANNKTSIRKTYSTSKKDDADLVQFIFKSCGYGTNFRTDARVCQNDNYLISLTKITQTKLNNNSSIWSKEAAKENDRCYCFQVESGMLVVRRHNRVFVSGNCGTMNLTRDYRFSELYCSTLEQCELNIGEQYNPEATKFQFDFLNDYIPMPDDMVTMETKMPKGLMDALRHDKPMVFFLNPPYATAVNWNETSKDGVAVNKINEQMKKDKIGACCQNIYAQFLYRIMQLKKQYNLTNCHIALFSPTLFLSGPSWKGFRNVFLKQFAFNEAIQFKASHFADVSDNWGISFSLWTNGETENKNEFEYTITDIDDECEVIKCGNKIVYNTDNNTPANIWVREPVKSFKTFDCPQMTSAIKVKTEGKTMRGSIVNHAFGYFFCGGNNIDSNTLNVAWFTSGYAMGNGVSACIDNFDRCTTLFSARKLIEKNWINSKDEYLAPNTEHPGWDEFVNDSLVYSLFHSSSNQSSLRNVEYKGKTWDIKNEFFFMDRDEIVDLANECSLSYTFNDARTSSDRYVAIRLRDATLSLEALAVLDKARELTRKTFKYRELFNSEHPEYQIMNWDASYYQMKPMWKEYAKDDFEAFRTLYKQLADKMRPMVYELGFLH